MVPLPLRAGNLDPKPAFHAMVRRYFHGALKPPFNEENAPKRGCRRTSTGRWRRRRLRSNDASTGRLARKGSDPRPPIGEISLKS
jgi:hypothetical protein